MTDLTTPPLAFTLASILVFLALPLEATPVKTCGESAHHAEAKGSRALEAVDGFALTIYDGHTAVVGLRLESESRVQISSGALTYERLEAIRAKVKRSFVAVARNGHGYVITDPGIVEQALALFRASAPRGEQCTNTLQFRDSKEAREVALREELQISQCQVRAVFKHPDLMMERKSLADREWIRLRLEGLIAIAKSSGKMSPVF